MANDFPSLTDSINLLNPSGSVRPKTFIRNNGGQKTVERHKTLKEKKLSTKLFFK